MIEHLPQELRDRLTEMREMDLQVQNSSDTLEKRVRTFFGNAKKMKVQEKEAEYEAIHKDYYKTLEDADEKVQLANQMYDLVARYIRRLEQETHNFKLELEADHMGITEILEKRSQELDAPPIPNSGNSSQKENRYSITSSRTSHQEKRRDSTSSNEHSSSSSNKRLATNVDKMLPDIRLPAAVGPVLLAGAQTPSAASAAAAVNYTLGHISAGGTAIAAAASQAIAATQQGRRTASLKASYEAIHSAASSNGGGGGGGSGGGAGGGSSASGSSGAGHVPHEISISKEIAGAAQTAIAAIQDTHKKHKKKNNSHLASGTSSPVVASPVASLQVQQPLSPTDSSEKNAEAYDPNEPRYCVCNEVAFGGMVACDNKKCPFEWYHYPCVGITEAPKGKWYCQLCSSSSTIKKRGARKAMSQC
ncbi:hypothetical protein LSTR_LSTR008318 [Laodelphax striatellus]|uniref:Inhibitor of growth protein n=1 Tax=Laodelphax striatellus TaxID=195883 RepID=A0A482XL03_LAOST|nr:hypothetical protein LSTR_LSTR008318 [Laodelphax striatellus]